MPLSVGSSNKIVSKNISKLEDEGYPNKQAIAISLSKDDHKKKEDFKTKMMPGQKPYSDSELEQLHGLVSDAADEDPGEENEPHWNETLKKYESINSMFSEEDHTIPGMSLIESHDDVKKLSDREEFEALLDIVSDVYYSNSSTILETAKTAFNKLKNAKGWEQLNVYEGYIEATNEFDFAGAYDNLLEQYLNIKGFKLQLDNIGNISIYKIDADESETPVVQGNNDVVGPIVSWQFLMNLNAFLEKTYVVRKNAKDKYNISNTMLDVNKPKTAKDYDAAIKKVIKLHADDATELAKKITSRNDTKKKENNTKKKENNTKKKENNMIKPYKRQFKEEDDVSDSDARAHHKIIRYFETLDKEALIDILINIIIDNPEEFEKWKVIVGE